MWSITWPRNGRLRGVGDREAEELAAGAQAGLAGDEAADAVLGRVLVGADPHAELRVLAERGGERRRRHARAAGAARRRRARGLPGPGGSALRREPNPRWYVRGSMRRLVIARSPCSLARGLRRRRAARTRTSPRASSRSRSSSASLPRRPAHRRERRVEAARAQRRRRDAAQRGGDGRDAAGGRATRRLAFGQSDVLAGQADSTRPIWVLDEGPKGGDTAYVNTWLAGHAAGRRGTRADLEPGAVEGRHVRARLPRRPGPHRQGARRRRARPAARCACGSRTSRRPRACGDGEVVRGEPVRGRIALAREAGASRSLDRRDVDGLRALRPGLGLVAHARALGAACGSRRC